MTSSTSKSWWQLSACVPSELADDVAALLICEGALGVTFHPSTLPLDCLVPVDVSAPPPGDHGREEGLVRLVAAFPGALVPEEIRTAARTALSQLGLDLPGGELELSVREDDDWAERWKDHFKPLSFGGRLWVLPSWLRDTPRPDGAIELIIDPQMAFGTGQHETTALCLVQLESLLGDAEGKRFSRVLDVGTGSGILAIAAAKLGASLVCAIDNDETAVAVCRDNVVLNAVADRVEVSDLPLAHLQDRYHLVVANILASVLIELADRLVAVVAPGGELIVSGILAEQAREVEAAIDAAGTKRSAKPELLETARRGAWVALRFAV